MAYRRIHSKGPYTYEEAQAGGTISPGHLIYLDARGYAFVHEEVGGRGEVAFAIENVLYGKAVGDNYSSGELCCYILPQKGCEVCARLKTGQTCAIGDELVSGGNGTLQVRGTGASGVTEHQTIGIAMEAKTATDNDLIRVRVV
jgi:hypothetical protein